MITGLITLTLFGVLCFAIVWLCGTIAIYFDKTPPDTSIAERVKLQPIIVAQFRQTLADIADLKAKIARAAPAETSAAQNALVKAIFALESAQIWFLDRTPDLAAEWLTKCDRHLKQAQLLLELASLLAGNTPDKKAG